SADLPQDRRRRAATRSAPHERHDTEGAREAATVLDLHEGPDAVQPGLGLHAGDRADVARDERRSVLAPPRDDGDLARDAGKGVAGEVRTAARDVYAPVRSRCASNGLARFADRLLRDTA